MDPRDNIRLRSTLENKFRGVRVREDNEIWTSGVRRIVALFIIALVILRGSVLTDCRLEISGARLTGAV